MNIRFFVFLFFLSLFCGTTCGDDSFKGELRCYQKTRADIPLSLRELSSATWLSRVPVNEALVEVKRQRENVERIERPANVAPKTPISADSRIFADWKRRPETSSDLELEMSVSVGAQNEVFLHSGEVFLAETDLTLPDRGGIAFTLVRYYRSHLDYNGPLGNGWDHNQNQRIIFNAATPDLATQAFWHDGRQRIRFQKSGDSWQPERGAFHRLIVSKERVEIESPLLQKAVFEPASKHLNQGFWRIKELASRHDGGTANVLQYRYTDDTDRLVEIVEPRGVIVTFHYDARDRLVEIGYGSNVVRYDYDTEGNLLAATVPNVANTLDNTVDLRWNYEYSQSRLVALTPPGDHRRNYRYDEAGNRCIEMSCTPKGNIENILVNWKIESRTEGGKNVVAIFSPAPSPCRVYQFDAFVAGGRLPVQMNIPSRKATYQYLYNDDFLLTEEQSPLGNKRQYCYDTDNVDVRFRGNLLEERILARPGENAVGLSEIGTVYEYHQQIALPVKETAFEVDINGTRRILRETKTDYSDDFEPSKIANGRQTTVIVYNRFGLPVLVGDALGGIDTYSYFDSFRSGTVGPNHGGLPAETVRDAAPDSVLTKLRQLIPSSDYVLLTQRKIESSPIQDRMRFEYDSTGLTVREISDDGYSMDSVYNKLGLLLLRYDTRSDLEVIQYDQNLWKESRSVRVSTMKDAPYQGISVSGLRGRFYQERYGRDALGRMIEWMPTREALAADGPPVIRYVRYPSGEIQIRRTADGGGIERVFDPDTGFLKEEKILSSKSSEQSLRQQTRLRYDSEGFLELFRDDIEAEYLIKSDPFGREFSRTGPDGIEHRSYRDGLGRTMRTESVLEGKTIAESKSVYDPEGNLILEQIRRLGETLDADGRPKAIDQCLVSGEHQYDELGRRIASRSLRKDAWTLFRYDGLDRVVSSTTPEGDQRMAVYDKGLEIVQIQRQKDSRTGKFETTKTYTYFDEQRNPYLSVPVGTDGKPAFERSSAQVFDTRGEIVQSATPGLMKETMIRNSMGWVICEHSEPLSKKHGEKPRRTETKYDPNGRVITRIIRNTPLALFAPTSTPTADFIPRLAAENIKVHQILQYGYDEYGRLRQTIHPDGLVKTNEYTRPGSMIEKVISTHPDDPAFKHAVGLRYDNLRRVTEIYDATRSGQDNRVQLFQYDPFGSLIRSEDRSSKRGQVVVHRRYDNLSNMLSERVETGDGQPIETFIFDSDFENGTETLRIQGEKHVTEQWTSMIRHTDKDGRLAAIDVDDDRWYSCIFSKISRKNGRTIVKSGTIGSLGGFSYGQPHSRSPKQPGFFRLKRNP